MVGEILFDKASFSYLQNGLWVFSLSTRGPNFFYPFSTCSDLNTILNTLTHLQRQISSVDIMTCKRCPFLTRWKDRRQQAEQKRLCRLQSQPYHTEQTVSYDSINRGGGNKWLTVYPALFEPYMNALAFLSVYQNFLKSNCKKSMVSLCPHCNWCNRYEKDLTCGYIYS